MLYWLVLFSLIIKSDYRQKEIWNNATSLIIEQLIMEVEAAPPPSKPYPPSLESYLKPLEIESRDTYPKH